jgi:hypothetical protein
MAESSGARALLPPLTSTNPGCPMSTLRVSTRTTVVVATLLVNASALSQIPTDTLATLAKIDAEFTRLGASTGESIWPGFRPDTIPIVFVVPGRGAALFGWKSSPPAGYDRINGSSGLWRSQQTLGAASTGVDLDGRTVAQVVASSLDPAYLLPTAFHEAFHVFERASIKPGRRFGRGENAFYISSYPAFDIDNEKLFAMEGRLLRTALAAKSSVQKRELAREFVAVRRNRHRLLDQDFAEFDRASELNEGLAEYALVRGLMAMRDDGALPAAWGESARHALTVHNARLGELTTNVTQSLRLRFYFTGPAQALLLDQLAGSGWKRKLVDQNETLTDALAAATGIDDAERNALALALRSNDTAAASRAAARGVAQLRALRLRQVDSVLAQPGLILELSASELPSKDFGFCGFDPQNHLQVSPTMQLQTRWWRPCSGAALSSEFNVPSIHDDEKGTVRAIIGPEADVKITVASQPVTIADGQTIENATDVRLVAPGVSAESARARIAREGRTIRITPLPPVKK